MTDDERFMTLALEEARAAEAEGNQPFGAVVVRGGEVVTRGHNLVVSTNDPTAHGEIVAIREACRALASPGLAGATLYTTCEPCLMCTGAVMWAGVARLVMGAVWTDSPQFHPEKGSLLGLAQQVDYPFEHSAGVLRDECMKLYGG